MGIVGGVFFGRRSPQSTSSAKHSIFLLASIGALCWMTGNQLQINDGLGVNIVYGTSFYAPIFLLLIISINSIKDINVSDSVSAILFKLGTLSFPMYVLQKPIGSIVFNALDKLHINEYLQLPIYLLTLLFSSIFIVKGIEMIKLSKSLLNNK